MSRYRTALLALAILAVPATASLHAQTPPPPGTSASQIQRQIDAMGLRSQVLSRLQSSGMTDAQIRQRLASMGYDPSTLDPYLTDDGSTPPEPNAQVLSAAEALGILEPAAPDTLTVLVREEPDSSAIERARDLRVFGLDVFRRSTSQFQPLTTGPVPPNYAVGPGDELVLLLSGDVEKSYVLPVTREGFVVIPQVGQVWVNGLTLDDVRSQLFTHLGRAYSGIRRGPEATTQFQLTLGQLRPNQVFVTGEVAQPGTYLVNAVASTLNALYLAGGPTPDGSFRDVRLMRGGEMLRRVDLYEYLLAGNNLSDIRLDPGDVLFVPTHHDQVSIDGEVVRPAIYEVLDDENFLDLLAFAGGLNAPAQTRRARITRILPPGERTEPGVDRVTIDVDLAEVLANPSLAPRLRAGDAVRIFPVRTEVRNTVTAQGALWQPGEFRYTPGMRAWDLIASADGLRDDAYLDRAQIIRMDPRDSTLAVIPFTLERDATGAPADNPSLREFDAVRVFAESRFTTAFPVVITGEVREPLTTTFEEGMTLRDLILRAGGIRPTADLTVEVARLPTQEERDGETIARIYRIEVDSTFLVSEQSQEFYLGSRAALDGAAAEFLLQPYDRVSVRELPEFDLQRFVEIRGDVRQPGSFTLARKDERLSSLIDRSGGLRSTAYAGGARLFRWGVQVNIDLPEALRSPSSSDNLVLLAGDSLFIPEYNPVVVVTGAVNSPSPVAVLYKEGASLGYYIENAGGFARSADEKRVHVRYANGEGRTGQSFLAFNRYPKPLPGSVVTVPALADADRINWSGLISDVAQVAGTIATVALLIARL